MRVRVFAVVQSSVVLAMVMGSSSVPIAPDVPDARKEMVPAVIEEPAVVVMAEESAMVNDWRLKALLRMKALLLVGSTIRLREVLLMAAWVAMSPLV